MFSNMCTLIMSIIFMIDSSDALDSEKCKLKPKEKHCLIEWSARNRWPHQIRYVFDWATDRCFEIRWSQHCPPVPTPASSNNFPSQESCLSQCSGWA